MSSGIFFYYFNHFNIVPMIYQSIKYECIVKYILFLPQGAAKASSHDDGHFSCRTPQIDRN